MRLVPARLIIAMATAMSEKEEEEKEKEGEEKEKEKEKKEEDKDASTDEERLSYSEIMARKIASMLKEASDLCEEGKVETAVAKLNRAIALQPDNPELFKQRAEAHFELCNYHAAILNFNKVIALKETEREAIHERLALVHYQYGVSLAASKNHSDAIEIFEKASFYDPSNKEIISRRVECLIALQRYTDCLGMIEMELKENDTNPDLLVIRAQLNILFGQTAKGYSDVCRALELDPDHTVAQEIKDDLELRARECKNQAVHQSLIGKKMDALKKISMAIGTDPTVPEYYILRGSLYRKMGDFNAAVEDYLCAMDKCGHKQDSPVYISASKQLILTYNDFAMECFKQRHFDIAITLLNRAIKDEKNEKGLYLNRGDCFYRMNNLRFALSDYQQALEIDSSDWDVYCRIAVVSCEIGVDLYAKAKYVLAEDYFSSAIHHNPKVSWFYVCRARARYELKHINGVKDDILASLVLDPYSNEPLSLIACVYSGKSKDELIYSDHFIKIYYEIESQIKCMSAKLKKKPDTQTPISKKQSDLSPKSANILGDLELRIENGEESEDEMLTPEISVNKLSSGEAVDGVQRSKTELILPEDRNTTKLVSKSAETVIWTSKVSESMKIKVFEKSIGSKIGEDRGTSQLASDGRTTVISGETLRSRRATVPSSGETSRSIRSRRRKSRDEDSISLATIEQVNKLALPLPLKEKGCAGEDGKVLKPREWSVLSYPLPVLNSDPHGLIPTLEDCLREAHFHKCIFYSKKNCTEQLEKMLRNPPEIASRLPKIQIAHDLILRGRTPQRKNIINKK